MGFAYKTDDPSLPRRGLLIYVVDLTEQAAMASHY